MIADFWNSGSVSDGCISAARSSGYFYIDWRGNITPCVFNPYAVANIYDLYKQGKTLNDIIYCPMFRAIQEWQKEYGYGDRNFRAKNYIIPCPIRDHHAFMRKVIDEYKPKPIDQSAKEALEDPEYYKGMVEYDKRLAELTDPVWEEECKAAEERLKLALEQGMDALTAISEEAHAESYKPDVKRR